jgi:hypothetical protein
MKSLHFFRRAFDRNEKSIFLGGTGACSWSRAVTGMTTSLRVGGHVACSHYTPRLRIKSITNIIADDNEIMLFWRMLAPSCCHQILSRAPSNRLTAIAVVSPSPADIRHVNQVVVLGPMLPTRDRFLFLEKFANRRCRLLAADQRRSRWSMVGARRAAIPRTVSPSTPNRSSRTPRS